MGTIWLFGRTNPNSLDTLGKAELKAGCFELNGKTPSGCLALIVMTDMQTGFQLMLENTKYTLNMDENGKVKIEGGKAQHLFQQFDEINPGVSQKNDKRQKKRLNRFDLKNRWCRCKMAIILLSKRL